jgi:protein-S-isoprenylcysteine O-methyltransferase Ste14
MPLKEEFEKGGNWLFKRRSWLPLAMLAPVGFAWTEYSDINLLYRFGTGWAIICLAVSLIGLIVRIFTVGHSAPSTSGRNRSKQIAQSLNTTGIYSTVRHPLYLGNFLMFLGVSMYPGIWWLSVILSLVFFLYYERIMFAEEEFLRGKFGKTYEDWATNTSAFIPKPKNIKASEYPFSLRKVLKHEHTSMLSMAVSFTVLNAADSFLFRKTFIMDRFVLWVLAVSAAIYIVLRILAKSTSMLDN